MKKIIYTMAAAAFIFSAPVLAEEGGKDKRHQKFAQKMEKKFQENDLDKNGSISKLEFLTASEKKFEELDADKSGEVTKEEMKAHMKAKHKERKERKEKMKADKEAGAEASDKAE